MLRTFFGLVALIFGISAAHAADPNCQKLLATVKTEKGIALPATIKDGKDGLTIKVDNPPAEVYLSALKPTEAPENWEASAGKGKNWVVVAHSGIMADYTGEKEYADAYEISLATAANGSCNITLISGNVEKDELPPPFAKIAQVDK